MGYRLINDSLKNLLISNRLCDIINLPTNKNLTEMMIRARADGRKTVSPQNLRRRKQRKGLRELLPKAKFGRIVHT